MTRFRRFIALPVAAIIVLALAMPVAAAPKGTLERYARDTWRSFVHMVDPNTGLPADNIAGSLHPSTRSEYTSPTNVGMYFWATLAARDLGYIGSTEASDRISQTLTTLESLERHQPSGQFWNWYSPQTGEKITIWPEDGSTVYPFASSVDNGWLASALIMVANAVPELHDRAWELAASMDFGCYYDPGANLIRGGFWLEGGNPPNSAGFPRDFYCDETGTDVVYTGHHYGAFNTEPRIASYIGIALDQIPERHYFGGWRTFPPTCDWAWVETRPVGEWVTYVVDDQAIDVFEGAYAFDDQLVVPTWGGSMFEALMVPLVVPEEEWGPMSWAVTHPLYVESAIEYGLDEEFADYGYWGHSPSSNPAGGYREYGIDAIGMEPNGYTSDVERLSLVDAGFPDGEGGYCDNPATPDVYDPRAPQPTTGRLRPGGCDAARRLPGARLRPRGDAREPCQLGSRLRGPVRPRRLQGCGERGHRRDRRPVPVARPGHGPRRPRQRADRQPAPGIPGGDAPAIAPAAHGDGAVRRGSNGAVSPAQGRGRRSAIGG